MRVTLLSLFLSSLLHFKVVHGFTAKLLEETAGGIPTNTVFVDERERIRQSQQIIPVEPNKTGVLSEFTFKDLGHLAVRFDKAYLSLVADGGPGKLIVATVRYQVQRPAVLSAQLDFEPVATLVSPNRWFVLAPSPNEQTLHINLTVKAHRMGSSFLVFFLRAAAAGEVQNLQGETFDRKDPGSVNRYLEALAQPGEYDSSGTAQVGVEVKVLRVRQLIVVVFRIVVAFLVVGITFLMGCELDPKKIFNHLKKPIGPVIGFACQFILMPTVC